MHIVFDAYGTLLDVHSAAARNEALLGEDWREVSETWRTRQLEYAWVATLAGRYQPFWDLTRRALTVALSLAGRGEDAALENALLDAYTDLTPFEDVVPALTALRDQGHTLSVLSNGNPAMLDKALGSSGLSELFVHVLSVEPAQRYKPHPDAYRVAEELLGVTGAGIVFVSSNAWDAAGASAYGLDARWLNRAGRVREYPDFDEVSAIGSLHDL